VPLPPLFFGRAVRPFDGPEALGMARKTPLYDLHRALGARTVDFGGWDMPVDYGSQIEEHHRVRRDAGMFDVSHMCIVDLHGAAARGFLSRLLANDVDKLRLVGKALYTCMLDPTGGVIDDLIVYLMERDEFRLVVNAGTRDKDLAWVRARAAEWGLAVQVVERSDLAMVAVQGPQARARVADLLDPEDRGAALALEPFFGRRCGEWFVARTGYTGEDGFEVMLPAAEAEPLWRALAAAGVASCGLGARDTLRLEAGLNLYGNDMDESRHPLESGLAWTVAFDPPSRDFVGRAALERLRGAGVPMKLVGLVLEERGVLRGHQKVAVPGIGEGEVTSGSWSPTLERSIALARVPQATGAVVQVEMRGKRLPARVVKPPFVRNGRILIDP
jgi:aminomethyltransferase